MTVTEALAQLDRDIAKAHRVAFAANDGFDPEWPMWNAPQLKPRFDTMLSTTLTCSEIVALLVEVNEGRLSPASIDPDGHLYDCGYLDSMSAAGFLAALKERFGVQLKESELVGRFDHVRALADRRVAFAALEAALGETLR